MARSKLDAPSSSRPFREPQAVLTKETLVKLLQSKKVRLSSRRLAIISALVALSPDHPTAEDLLQEVRRNGEKMGVATVYNTLALLLRHGVVTELGFPSGPSRFDLNLSPHANLVCTKCGRISDQPFDGLVEKSRKIGMRSKFEVQRLRLDLYGICADCRTVDFRTI